MDVYCKYKKAQLLWGYNSLELSMQDTIAESELKQEPKQAAKKGTESVSLNSELFQLFSVCI